MPSQEDHQPILGAGEEVLGGGGVGWDGEQWSVGNCEKENINIAQMLNSYTTDDTDTDGGV